MPRTLLLADDSITIQKVVAITFANEDFTVTAVDNGEDALTKAREIRPDIILADVVMPRRNGYELCQAIKADPALRSIPVLLLAGTFEAFDEGKAVAAQANGHIVKPFDSQVLIDRVNAIVSGGQPQATSVSTPVAPRPTIAIQVPVAPPAPPAFSMPKSPLSGVIPGIPVQRSPSIPPPPPPVAGGGLPPLSRPPAPPAPTAPPVVAAPPRPPAPFIPGAGLPPAAPPAASRPAFLGNPTPMLVPGGLPPIGAPPVVPGASRPPFVPGPSPFTASPPPGISIGKPPTRPPTPAPVQPRPMSPTPAPWAVSSSPSSVKPGVVAPPTPAPRSATMAWSAELGLPAVPEAPAQRAKPTPTPMWGVPVAKPTPAAPPPYTPGFPRTQPSVVVAAGVKSSSSDVSLEVSEVSMEDESAKGGLDLPLDETPLELESVSAASVRASGSVQLDISEASGDEIRTSSLSDLAQPGSRPAPVGEIEIEADGNPGDQVELASATEFVPGAVKSPSVPVVPVAAPRPPTRPPIAARTPAPSAAAADGGEAGLRAALSQASREVIEKIAWEVVPQLAEVIIREHVERLARERSSK